VRGKQAVAAVRWVLIAAAVASTGMTVAGLVFGYQVVAVTSGSMRPAIEPGDALLVSRGSSRVGVGDVIVFAPPSAARMVAHRVVSVRETGGAPYYQVKGDANATPDANLVPTGQVYGRVILDLPGGGPTLYWFTQVGLKISLAMLFAIIFAEELFVLVPDLRRYWATRRARVRG
jgi:signal peptidase I